MCCWAKLSWTAHADQPILFLQVHSTLTQAEAGESLPAPGAHPASFELAPSQPQMEIKSHGQIEQGADGMLCLGPLCTLESQRLWFLNALLRQPGAKRPFLSIGTACNCQGVLQVSA